MQRIEIENFGPIKSVAFDIKDYTIFIGPQASGKSTIARAVYFFRSLGEDLRSAMMSSMPDFQRERIDMDIMDRITKKMWTLWDPVCWNSKTKLFFHYADDLEISISCEENNQFVISLTGGWDDLWNQAENLWHRTQQEQGKKDVPDGIVSFVTACHFMDFLFPFLQVRPTFIPAGRVLFSAVEDSLIPREQKLADILVARFFDFCGYIKKEFGQRSKKSLHSSKRKSKSAIPDKILALSENILGGTVKFQKDRCFLSLSSQESSSQEGLLQIANASSGQQEAVWILLYAAYLCDQNITDIFTVIEEPEAHLFPKAQKNMMYLLTLVANQGTNQLMLTTHSPYILTPLNNLLLAHKIGQDKQKAVEKIVDPDLWIDPDRFECYYVDNGSIRSVMDRDTGMMNLDELDAVSSMLNEQYDRLEELED
jgi:AAA15 family ATPase/GTPase